MSKVSLGRVSLVPKGAYSAVTAYKQLDVVTYDGASYIVLRPVQGVTPVDGEDYMLLTEDGSAPELSIGTVTTLDAGSKAAASIGGTAEKPVLNLDIPKGDPGATPELQMGTVKTLDPGSEAKASFTGTAEKPVLNLELPRGASGGVDVASAKVGQTIVVKAVDENGVPTEWEAADMASGGSAEYVLLAEVILEEAAVIQIDDDERFANYSDFFIECAIPVGTAASFNKYTAICGVYDIINNVSAIHATYGTVNTFSLVRHDNGGCVGCRSIRNTTSTAPNYGEVARAGMLFYAVQSIGGDCATDYMFYSAIELPAGTKVRISGR